MEIVSGDKFFAVKPPARANYRGDNPLAQLMTLLEGVELAAEREFYVLNKTQYLIPFDQLELYGPSTDQWNVGDVRQQDNKEDFQKQNIRSFQTTDTRLARGWVQVDDWTGPFLLLSYRGGPDSKLSQAAGHNLGAEIKVFVKTGNRNGVLLDVPYNPRTDRYEIELWGYPKGDLVNKLYDKGAEALNRGGIAARPDLIPGQATDFAREALDNRDMRTVAPDNLMHPVNPVTIEVAWATSTQQVWDSNGGRNYRYQFNMVFRGWSNFLKAGVSEAPHGGFGFLHYRNVLSNYFEFRNSGELGRDVETWMFDANGQKPARRKRESFLAVDYVDLHILKPECGIGIHRHRDNQEIFFMMRGTGIMMVGDWCKLDERERCFEIRTMEAGEFSLLKPGNLHSLFNVTDEDLELLMFGGYD